MPKRKLLAEAQELAEQPKRTRAAASAAAQPIIKKTTSRTPPFPKIKPKAPPSPKGKAPASSKGSKTTTSKASPTKTPKRTSVRKKSPPKKSLSRPALKKAKKPIRRPLPIEKLPLDTKSSGQVFVYGANDAGQLSAKDELTERQFPNQIRLIAFGNEQIVKVACGSMFSVVVTESGRAFTWGYVDEGALGTGNDHEDGSYKPKPVTEIEGKIVAVSAGDAHTAFLNEDGMVYLTGTMRDSVGQIGLRPDTSELCEFQPFLYPNPRRSDLRNDRAVKVSSGYSHMAFLTSGGAVYLMGDPGYGALGAVSSRRLHGDQRYFLKKREVLRLKKPRVVKFSDVWCTPYATFVRSAKEDRWFVCGINQNNQLGFPRVIVSVTTENHNPQNITSENPATHHSANENSTEERKTEAPKPPIYATVTDWAEVTGFRDKKVIKIVGTETQTVALTDDGRLLACGDTAFFGLSLQTRHTDFPVELPFTQGGQRVRDIGCSSNDAVVCVTEAGEVAVWGSSASYVVGSRSKDSTTRVVRLPTRVQDVDQTPGNVGRKPFEDFRMVQVAVGALHALMIGKPNPPGLNGSCSAHL